MYNKISTKEFAEYYCSKVVSDYLDNKYTIDYFIDFKISKNELPHNFNEEEFLQVFKSNFNIIKIELIDYLDYGIHVFGKVKCNSNTDEDLFESAKHLRSLAPTVQEAVTFIDDFSKVVKSLSLTSEELIDSYNFNRELHPSIEEAKNALNIFAQNIQNDIENSYPKK